MLDLTIAIIQSNLHWESVDANLAMFEEKIWNIPSDIDLIILPEMFNTGFSINPEKLAEVPGLKTHKWLLQMAGQKKAVLGGSYIVKEGQDYFNRFFATFPDGNYQTYDKRHLFSLVGEDELFKAGVDRLVFNLKGWSVCPLICYDLRFPAFAKNRVDKSTKEFEYDLLIYVANWPEARISAWDTLLQARAIENQSYTIGANRVGQDGNGYQYSGHSGVYNYLGEELAKIEDKEGVIIQKLSKITQNQFRTKFPFVADSDLYSI